jgi:hypothetical protein
MQQPRSGPEEFRVNPSASMEKPNGIWSHLPQQQAGVECNIPVTAEFVAPSTLLQINK